MFQELSKQINLKNEASAAGKAEQHGGRLGVVKAAAGAADAQKGGKRDRKK